MKRALLNMVLLYRLDVSLIAFGTVLFGGVVGGALTGSHFLVAVLIALLSMNAVYSLNSYTDLAADRINKPCRPLSKGELKPQEAVVVVTMVSGLALLWPWLLILPIKVKLLSVSIPLLGALYSLPFLRVRRSVVATLGVAALIWLLPFLVGLLLRNGAVHLPATLFFFMFCTVLVPLKDLTDVAGDRRAGYANWVARFGETKVMNTCLILTLLHLGALFWPARLFSWPVTLLFVLADLTVVIEIIRERFTFKRSRFLLYERILRSLAFGGPVVVLGISLW